MVVGQTGGGKSVIVHTLAKAQTNLGKKTHLAIINPKVSVYSLQLGLLLPLLVSGWAGQDLPGLCLSLFVPGKKR